MTTPLALATLGGGISFLSTTFGALIPLLSTHPGKGSRNGRFSLTIDFALGLMVSASAFSLIGPAAMDFRLHGGSILTILLTALLGGLAVYILKWQLDRKLEPGSRSENRRRTGQLILVSMLMAHNFPEGLASGAAAAGLGWQGALPILGGIALQNVPEGALMVLCLKALGFSPRVSFAGGVGSGLVELTGGVLAGLLLSFVQGALPFLLALAGGAMLFSVALEVFSEREKLSSRLLSTQFIGGLTVLPFLQWVTA